MTLATPKQIEITQQGGGHRLDFSIADLDIFLLGAPLRIPRRNAFGIMNERPALIVRLTDKDGWQGWGEVFCNWPSFAGEHRLRILDQILKSMVTHGEHVSPASLSQTLVRKTNAIRIQSGEHGPFHQSIAALDIAAWDLCARRAGLPLYKLLNPSAPDDLVTVYASGLTAATDAQTLMHCQTQGISKFKLKVGFSRKEDLVNITALRETVGDDAQIMTDGNQAWNLTQALEMCRAFADYDLSWLEEPLSAEAPLNDWRELAERTDIPLAAGENIFDAKRFDQFLAADCLRIIQPDPIKWGGLTGCLKIAQLAAARGIRFCPHYLGGGIGLMAAAHLAAADGRDRLLELDVTENPLREGLATPFPIIKNGQIRLGEQIGIGCIPDLDMLSGYLKKTV